MRSMPKRFKYEMFALAVLMGYFLGATLPTVLASRNNAYKFFDTLVDLRAQLVDHYVEEVDQKDLQAGAIEGMIKTLHDPYTNYFVPKQLKSFQKLTKGSFSGIGAEINVRGGQLIIVAPLEDSPSYKAGIKPGDVVLEVDDKPIPHTITSTEAVEWLTGEEGTPVKLKVRHQNKKEETITVIRAKIKLETIKGLYRQANGHWRFMLDKKNKVGYIRMTQFSAPTYDELTTAIKELKNEGMKGIILDLRYNPGGLLNSAVKIADLFVNDGVIVSTKGRNSKQDRVEKATSKTTLPDFPLIVLVNEYSASASEILSGALKDHNRAIVLGTRTLGKGSVQQIFPLNSPDGPAGIKITTAHYYLPSGRNIHRHKNNDSWGVDPTDGYYVSMTLDEKEKMAEVRNADVNLYKPTDDQPQGPIVTPDWLTENIKDQQLTAALQTIVAKLTTDQWEKVGKENATVLTHIIEREKMIRGRELYEERIALINEEIAKITAKIENGGDDENGDADPDTDNADDKTEKGDSSDEAKSDAPKESSKDDTDNTKKAKESKTDDGKDKE